MIRFCLRIARESITIPEILQGSVLALTVLGE